MTRRCPEDGMRYTESFLTTQTCINNSNTTIQQYDSSVSVSTRLPDEACPELRRVQPASPHQLFQTVVLDELQALRERFSQTFALLRFDIWIERGLGEFLEQGKNCGHPHGHVTLSVSV